MRFERDLFISYAHIDNKPLTPEQQGWITRFHASLEALLSMRMGGKARIWRDNKLQGNDVFGREIVDQFAKTAVLVSVLTPRYLKSDWCNKEVAEFCKRAEESGGMVIANKARIFKVLKAPVDTQESLPQVVKDVLGYEFFTIEDGTPLELDLAYGEKFGQDYHRKVGKLAWDVSQLLRTLEAGTRDNSHDDQGAHKPVNPAKPTVYLAECSYDRKQAREILEGELKRHGYTVLPDQELPRDEEEYVAAVERLLKSCKLSIHLVGETYGGVPDGPSQKSEVVLQNELAARQSKSNGLKRVIWVPEGTHSKQSQQQAFIEALHQDAEAQIGADLITADIEGLKTSIHAILTKLEKPEPQPTDEAAAANQPKLIYLIFNEKDRKAKATVPLRKFLRDQGFKVEIPAFEGDAAAVRETHQQAMTNCEAVILFYGAGDEAWKRTIDNELKKMPGYRSGKPLLASYTFLADPKTTDKEDLLEMEEPNLINGLGDFSETMMTGFFQAMNPRER
jgi:predicted RNase H-like HicB family nuclease